MLETKAPGGQAASSSKIENYLGFPTGISGQELGARAFAQSQKFGAQIMISKAAKHFRCTRKPYTIELDDGLSLSARTIIIATGVQYHRPALENLARFEGAGIYYGATLIEAQLCGNRNNCRGWWKFGRTSRCLFSAIRQMCPYAHSLTCFSGEYVSVISCNESKKIQQLA